MRLSKAPKQPKPGKQPKTPPMKPGRIRTALATTYDRRPALTWSNILKGAVITIGILIFLFMATLICTPNPAPALPDQPPLTQQDFPDPISSQSPVQLTREEIDEKTADYLALNLWAEVAHRTANDEPENFLPVIFSVPDTECVEGYRQVLAERPVPYPDPVNQASATPEEYRAYLDQVRETQERLNALQDEHLLGCTTENINSNQTRTWDELSEDEQEARARRAMRLLALSIDPPLLMATNIASSRGLLVNSQNNPEFAQFASEYDTCQVQADGFAAPLAQAQSPQQMAQLWLQAYNHLKNCFNTITGVIFPTTAPTPIPGDAARASPLGVTHIKKKSQQIEPT